MPETITDLCQKKRLVPKYMLKRIDFYSDLSLEFYKPAIRSAGKTFSENLAEIYRDSVKCIILAENYCKTKKRSYLKSITKDERFFQTKSIARKIEILGDYTPLIENRDNPVKEFYLLLFYQLKKIHSEYSEVIKTKPGLLPIKENNITESDEEKIYYTILNEKSLEDEDFRNGFLNSILLLQIPTGHLHRIVNPIPGIPSLPDTRFNRARKGAEKSNKDRDEIIKIFINHIRKNKPEKFISAKELKEFNKREENKKLVYKFKTISKFCEAHFDEFVKIIDSYKENNPTSAYANKIDPINFKNILSSWKKTSQALKAEIDFHVYSANKEYSE